MSTSPEIEERDAGDPPFEPRNAKEAVYAMLGSQLRTTLSDGRIVEGRLQCMDRLTNFILADAVETATAAAAAPGEGVRGDGGGISGSGECRNGVAAEEDGGKGVGGSETRLEAQQAAPQQRHLGMVMIPGKHLVSVQRL